MKYKLTVLLLVLMLIPVSGQKQFIYYPNGLLISPFQANFLEPKLGVLIHTGQNDLRLDIGASRDLLHVAEKTHTMSVGADFFTYTKLRGEKDFHFPVDAVDYLFGINSGLLIKGLGYDYGFRFRLSHISAHLVDGHYDGTNNRWINNQPPRVYSREFIELTPYIQTSTTRCYVNYTWLFHVNPDFLGKHSIQMGAEHYFEGMLGEKMRPFVSVDLKLRKIYSYRVNQTLQAGIKFSNSSYSQGASLYALYYNGTNNHGEYFDFEESFAGIGMNLDF